MNLSSALWDSLRFWAVDFAKISLLMALLFYGLMYLRTYLSPERISRTLRRHRVASYPLAAGFGVLSPFCSCSTIPLFLGFLGMGVGLGATLTFLLASPMVNLAAVAIMPTVIGLEPTVFYALAGVVLSIGAGFLLEKSGFERFVHRPEMSQPPETNAGDRFRVAWQRTREQLAELLPYVAAGTAVGALIHGFLPQELLQQYASGPLAVPAAVLLGVPMYTNVLAAIPIVEALLQKGVELPVALVFLLSASGLSLPEFIMLKKVMDTKLLAAFVGVIAVGITGMGYVMYWL